jgi:hypothetical protein
VSMLDALPRLAAANVRLTDWNQDKRFACVLRVAMVKGYLLDEHDALTDRARLQHSDGARAALDHAIETNRAQLRALHDLLYPANYRDLWWYGCTRGYPLHAETMTIDIVLRLILDWRRDGKPDVNDTGASLLCPECGSLTQTYASNNQRDGEPGATWYHGVQCPECFWARAVASGLTRDKLPAVDVYA